MHKNRALAGVRPLARNDMAKENEVLNMRIIKGKIDEYYKYG